jgi:DNA-binding transcriptional MerR regulator
VAAVEKAPGAFKTIGELSVELGVAQHILRYWETKFPQLKPLQRAGNRRYYRPADVELAHRINRLLNQEGYTVRGVQKLLRGGQSADEQSPQLVSDYQPAAASREEAGPSLDLQRLRQIRDRLAEALDQ